MTTVNFKLLCIASLLVFLLFPGSVLLPFLPLIIASLVHKTPLSALITSVIIGFVYDLFSCELPFGSVSLIYFLTTLLLLRIRKFIFFDKLWGTFTLSFLYSISLTCVQWIVFLVCGKKIRMALHSTLSDCFFLPLCDGLYTLLLLFVPATLYAWLKKNRFFVDFFTQAKEKVFKTVKRIKT